MNLNNISLPYPVLGISDDVLPMLDNDCVSVSVEADHFTYKFSIDLKFDNADIEQLIKDGKAEYTCEYECARTMLRKCAKSATPHLDIVISRREINARVNFNCFVSVKKPIQDYTNKGFNSDYEGASFNMEQGDILVAFPQYHYDADIQYDQLQVAGSFMQICEDKQGKEVSFDITGDRINILLPTPLYNLYCNPQVKGAAQVIHSSLVMNALTYALLNIEDYENTTLWARTIIYRLKSEQEFKGVEELEDTKNIPTIADRLLKDPYGRLFNHLITTNSLSQD